MITRDIEHGLTKLDIFESVEELVEFAMSVPRIRMDPVLADHTDEGDNKHRFTGRQFDAWVDVQAATRSAWDEGLQVLADMLAQLTTADLPKPVCRKRKLRWRDDDGDELDNDRLRSGQQFWRSAYRQQVAGPQVVTILVDVAANCGVKYLDILWRGAAAVALTKILEDAGYRVELWSVLSDRELWNQRGTDYHNLTGVCLKRPSDPLDESTLITAVSGWFFRTVHFRAYCQGTKKINLGLGHTTAPTAEQLDEFSTDPQRIVIKGAFTFDDAVCTAREALAAFTTRSEK
jgi:hypothetical protein